MIFGIAAVNTKEGYIETLFTLDMTWTDPSLLSIFFIDKLDLG